MTNRAALDRRLFDQSSNTPKFFCLKQNYLNTEFYRISKQKAAIFIKELYEIEQIFHFPFG